MPTKRSTVGGKPADALAWQLARMGWPPPVREFRFAPPRRWRLDFAWPDKLLAVEVEGGIWIGGRHVRPKGFLSDIEKYNQLSLLGWRLLRVTPDHIRSGDALRLIESALQSHP